MGTNKKSKDSQTKKYFSKGLIYRIGLCVAGAMLATSIVLPILALQQCSSNSSPTNDGDQNNPEIGNSLVISDDLLNSDYIIPPKNNIWVNGGNEQQFGNPLLNMKKFCYENPSDKNNFVIVGQIHFGFLLDPEQSYHFFGIDGAQVVIAPNGGSISQSLLNLPFIAFTIGIFGQQPTDPSIWDYNEHLQFDSSINFVVNAPQAYGAKFWCSFTKEANIDINSNFFIDSFTLGQDVEEGMRRFAILFHFLNANILGTFHFSGYHFIQSSAEAQAFYFEACHVSLDLLDEGKYDIMAQDVNGNAHTKLRGYYFDKLSEFLECNIVFKGKFTIINKNTDSSIYGFLTDAKLKGDLDMTIDGEIIISSNVISDSSNDAAVWLDLSQAEYDDNFPDGNQFASCHINVGATIILNNTSQKEPATPSFHYGIRINSLNCNFSFTGTIIIYSIFMPAEGIDVQFSKIFSGYTLSITGTCIIKSTSAETVGILIGEITPGTQLSIIINIHPTLLISCKEKSATGIIFSGFTDIAQIEINGTYTIISSEANAIGVYLPEGGTIGGYLNIDAVFTVESGGADAGSSASVGVKVDSDYIDDSADIIVQGSFCLIATATDSHACFIYRDSKAASQDNLNNITSTDLETYIYSNKGLDELEIFILDDTWSSSFLWNGHTINKDTYSVDSYPDSKLTIDWVLPEDTMPLFNIKVINMCTPENDSLHLFNTQYKNVLSSYILLNLCPDYMKEIIETIIGGINT